MSDQGKYNNWTKAGLIQRVKELEQQLHQEKHKQPRKEGDEVAPPVKKPKGKKKMDPSKYSTRYIALKLAYLGKNYGGFEFQAMGNQPSIEEELWNALTKACLIFPEDEKLVDFDCCEYSKCGRTDRGVSAFGQVIGLRVRSNRPLPKEPAQNEDAPGELLQEESGADQNQQQQEELVKPFDDIRDEISYPHVLNRLLPKEIRILAWCPSPPPDFSARFSCRERQYRKIMKSGWLDIEAMRDAAKRYEGEHDFRNLCKIDPAKQITNFKRRMFESDIVEVKDAASALPYLKAAGFAPEDLALNSGEVYPKVYYFHVRGSAFLWHQIRHMVAVLFLVGQGLEQPSLVSELLDVERNPRRPNYVMADEVPLVLWDCIFPSDLSQSTAAHREDDALQWVYVGDDGPSGRFGQFGIMDDTWQMWRERKMDEILAGQLLQHVSQQGNNGSTAARAAPASSANSTKVFEGGNGGRLSGKYPGVMKMKLLESADEQNDKYAKRKGYVDAEDMRAKKGFRSNKEQDVDTPMADE
ncbi:tRNA pseudouridine synthase domain-containing protein [Trichoderma breve]|uniref:tRNA pseudouridine synthase domain-containing protein n=1 Tax=Trichoderma breve TaxID=2034170 RepID=A0A9W9ECY6_9HYPO|nr:tRNA pseudouridine synthase domain-containing protein [Trichoderma breve]KAJ4864378.1 tRNA pseudouridine synthase domain-containing protein [Trichoderma breve]